MALGWVEILVAESSTATALAKCQLLRAKLLQLTGKEKPTGRLLGACSGRRPMGYRFSLLTLLFSGVINLSKHGLRRKFRGLV